MLTPSSWPKFPSSSEIKGAYEELVLAMDLKELDKVKELLNKVDLKQQKGPLQSTILDQAAVSHIDAEILQMVVDKYKQEKVSLDIPDAKGFTPLDKALALQEDVVAKILIRGGADYNRASPGAKESYLTHFLNKKSAEERQKFESFLNEVVKERREKAKQVSVMTTLYNYFIGKTSATPKGQSDPETEGLLKAGHKTTSSRTKGE